MGLNPWNGCEFVGKSVVCISCTSAEEGMRTMLGSGGG